MNNELQGLYERCGSAISDWTYYARSCLL